MSAAPLALRDGDRARLEALVRSGSVGAGLARRARILLLADDGLPNAEIARRTGTSQPTVADWRARYERGGIPALADLPRSGRPPRVDEIEVVLATLAANGCPPPRLGVAHWSARLLAAELGISFATVARIWRRWGLQPQRVDGFTFSTEPELDARIGDVVGVYLNPPTNAVVVCLDEESRIPALDGTDPIPPLRPGPAGEQRDDHLRDATTALFAALEAATGKATEAGRPRRRDTGLLAFLKQAAKSHPGVELHVVTDNHVAGKRPATNAWLAGDQRITVHLTPTAEYWLGLVQVLFAISTSRGGGRDAVESVGGLTAAVEAFIDSWDEHRGPLVWINEVNRITTRPTVGQTAPPATRFPGVGEKTDQFTAAIEAIQAGFDALETAVGEIHASPVPTTELAAAVKALRERLEKVESAGDGSRTAPTSDVVPVTATREAVLGADVRGEVMAKTSANWLLDRLELNTGPLYTRGNFKGSLAFGGIVRMPGSGEVNWQGEYTVPDVMACDLRAAAVVLAALGHPLRLEFLRGMLLGASTAGQLQEIDGVGTAGQVQHHLRELRAAGLVVSHRRNHYAIPPDRVVPLLLIVGLALGRRVYGSAGPDPIGDEEPTRHSAEADAQPALPATKYWVLDHLVRNTGPKYTRGDTNGRIAYGGIAYGGTASAAFDVKWSGQFTVPDIAASDLPSAAVVLAALGHPVRLQLLRRMLLGARTVGEFQKINGIGSTGQVHHHLRELRVAEHVVSATRNHYTLPIYRVVPFLVTVAACVGRRVFAAAGHDPEVDEL